MAAQAWSGNVFQQFPEALEAALSPSIKWEWQEATLGGPAKEGAAQASALRGRGKHPPAPPEPQSRLSPHDLG